MERDLISREAALQALEREDAGKGAIDAIKDMTAAFKWIPMDKPPEAFGRYLVMAADWGSWRIDFDFWIDGRWVQHIDVEAWAEIPEEWRE